MFVADTRLFKVAGNIEKYSDGINISVDAFIKNSFGKVNLKLKNSSSLQELCIDGVFLNKNFGYCLSSHREEFSKSINMNVLSRGLIKILFIKILLFLQLTFYFFNLIVSFV